MVTQTRPTFSSLLSQYGPDADSLRRLTLNPAAATPNSSETTANYLNSPEGKSAINNLYSSTLIDSTTITNANTLASTSSTSQAQANEKILSASTNAGIPSRKRTTARLYSLATQSNSSNIVYIEFPAMPETIELAREVNYVNYAQTPVTPDGLHMYKNTEPLKIPISFKLHAADREYCTAGPLTLLLLTARLEAFALPVSENANRAAQSSALSNGATPPPLIPTGSEDGLIASYTTTNVGTTQVSNSSFAPPVAVLDLIQGGNLGIVCRGFIANLKVTLNGPWLNPDSSKTSVARNLPTWAEYSFVFVHCPGYTNSLVTDTSSVASVAGPGGFQGQAFGPDVLRNLFADLGLSSTPAIGFGE